MNNRTIVAVVIQLIAMTWVVVPPVWLARNGTVAYLETEKMDPRALFRGDYVILGYRQAQDVVPAEMAQEARLAGNPVYVTFTTDRPARFVGVALEPPSLREGEVCVVGRVRIFRWDLDADGVPTQPVYAADFPQIAQYFVAEGEGRALEEARGEDLLARVATSDSCNAVLLGLEPR